MHWNKGRRSSWYVQWIQMSLSYLLAPSMTCLRLNLWSTSGLLLVWARITGFTTSTPSVQASGSHDQKAYLCSMHTLAVTRPLHSMEKARSQYGKPGSLMKMLQRHLYFWPTIPSSSSNWVMNHSRSSRDWLLFCMTKPALWPQSMKQERNFSARRIWQWTNCHPPRMHCSSTWDEQCIKQESGLPAHKHSRWFLLHNSMPGTRYPTYGCLFGWQLQKFQERAGSSLNVPAKETVPTAAVAEQTWTVHHFANVNVFWTSESVNCFWINSEFFPALGLRLSPFLQFLTQAGQKHQTCPAAPSPELPLPHRLSPTLWW